MKNKKLLSFFVVFSFLSVFVVCASSSFALNENTVSVDPAIINLNLPQGPNSSASSNFNITNYYSVPIQLNIELKGIDNQSGRIVPSGDIEKGLDSSIKLSQTQITLKSGEKQTIKVQVNDSKLLKPGGHYASIVISQNAPASRSTSIRTELSVGLFVIKEEGSVSSLKLSTLQLNRFLFDYPNSAGVELINDGNVQITPRGYIRIYDNSEVFYETVFNKQSRIILPGGKYKQVINDLSTKPSLIPRKINVEVGYRPSTGSNDKIYKTSFWYVPFMYFWVILFIVILVILALLLYFLGFRLKKQNNRITIKKTSAES